jgi:ParB/RepB/Spo0J family partition protein
VTITNENLAQPNDLIEVETTSTGLMQGPFPSPEAQPAIPNPKPSELRLAPDTEQVLRIPFYQLVPSPTNPRKSKDKKADDELAASIKDNYAHGGPGVLEPILCRPSGDITDTLIDPPKYEVVAGNRRLAAAKKAGLDDVPCIIRPMTDAQALEVQIVENLQRKDVLPIDEARGFKALVDHGAKVEAIAKRIGKSKEYVYGSLKLCDLGESGQLLMESGALPAGHAVQIARLPLSAQGKAMAWLFPSWSKGDRPNASVRELAEYIKSGLMVSLETAPFLEIENGKLFDRTLCTGYEGAPGACASCPKMSGNDPAMKDLKGDICTDLECYNKKVQANIGRILDEADVAGMPLIELWDTFDNTPASENPKHLNRGQFIYGNPTLLVGCKSIAVGIWRSGPNVSQTTDICFDQTCETHFPKQTTGKQAPSSKATPDRDPLAGRILRRAWGLAIDHLLTTKGCITKKAALKAIYEVLYDMFHWQFTDEAVGEMLSAEVAALPHLLGRKRTPQDATPKEYARAILIILAFSADKFAPPVQKFKKQAAREVKAEWRAEQQEPIKDKKEAKPRKRR